MKKIRKFFQSYNNKLLLSIFFITISFIGSIFIFSYLFKRNISEARHVTHHQPTAHNIYDEHNDLDHFGDHDDHDHHDNHHDEHGDHDEIEGLHHDQHKAIPEAEHAHAHKGGHDHDDVIQKPFDEANTRIILRLHGSHTIGEELIPALAKSYLSKMGVKNIQTKKYNEHYNMYVEGLLNNRPVAIEIILNGTSRGFKTVASGQSDISMASRQINKQELQVFQYLAKFTTEACEHVLALDGISVIVNPSNPVNVLTLDQLAAIFTGQVQSWSDLGLPGGKIHICTREKESGNYYVFNNVVLKGRSLNPRARVFDCNHDISEHVALDPNAIGFTSLPDILTAKPVAIADEGSSLFPTFFTVATEDYPISRRFYLYSMPTPKNPHTRKFIDFALSESGQTVVMETGFVDLNIRTFVPKIDKLSIAENKPHIEKYFKKVQQAKRLSLNFRFQMDGFNLDARGKKDIDRIVRFLKKRDFGGIDIILAGFTDSIGDATYNQELATKRAISVAHEFYSRGINDVTVMGVGEEIPIASNNKEIGRAKNRRVEVWMGTN